MAEELGWLQISTEGFGAFNKARPPGHLVKELVQNGFDAIGTDSGEVTLSYAVRDGRIQVCCSDTGVGIADLSALRTVYLTSKTDSHLNRGRFGRGFKEILSVASWARATSGDHAIEFFIEAGERRMRRMPAESALRGTTIEMAFDWPASTVEEFDTYFLRFLPPANVTFAINGRTVAFRTARYIVDATLPTEVFDVEAHAWRKPQRKTTIELIRASDGEEPFLFEMGIPIAPAEWTLPFHGNIQQRVPMNPNRDAFASGYATKIHSACLPVVLDDMSRDEVTADWVGPAGARCEPQVRREVIIKAFGETAVRAVPAMGKRDFNDDAMRFGAEIVHTSQMSSGFREMARVHLPSAKVHVDHVDQQRAEAAATQRFSPDTVWDALDERQKWIDQQGGSKRVNQVLSFAVWFCQQLVNTAPERIAPVKGHLALGRRPPIGTPPFQAHWSSVNDLTLALEEDCFWDDPLGDESLMILIHEAAHAMNLHHGRSFNGEVERLAGVAAALMYREAENIRVKWRLGHDG